MRRVQISVICTRFARYLYSRKQSWIIKYNQDQFRGPKQARIKGFEMGGELPVSVCFEERGM